MVLLVALPVFAAVALAYRYLQLYAPTNVLARGVMATGPRLHTVLGLFALAAGLLATMHLAAGAITAGAPGYLNLVVWVLAWDAIKVGWLAVGAVGRLVAFTLRRLVGSHNV